MTLHPSQDERIENMAQPPSALRIPQELVLSALERLIIQGNTKLGAKRLRDNASLHGIDLNLVWGVPGTDDAGRTFVRQVCMVVPGSGGTGMCFLSIPREEGRLGDRPTQIREIHAALSCAMRDLDQGTTPTIRIAQVLMELRHDWARPVCEDSGMICVGTLDYMRLDYNTARSLQSTPGFEDPIRVRPFSSFRDPERDEILKAALEGSYEDTLDCPELCGLRPMEDVIASHKATGAFDPSRWWILTRNDDPVGCCLLTHCPGNQSVELVYLGLAPSMRGNGYGKRLLIHGLSRIDISEKVLEVTCAVDRRNTPAMRMYASLGFTPFDARQGFVRSIG